jgi:hypothetical protein
VIALTAACASKLRPGGILVIETVNPRVVHALQRFYIDFTHVRLYDPEAMAWLLGQQGFTNVSIEYSLAAADLRLPPLETAGADTVAFDDAITRMNDLLYGPTAYAVTATKPD